MKKPLLIVIVLALSLSYCKKEDKSGEEPGLPVEIKDSILAQNLSHVWEILWGPDNDIWLTERGGKISRLNPLTGVVTPVLTISEVVANGEGGLLGMALHPNFRMQPHVFVAYNYNQGGNYREKIVRFTYDGNTLISPFTVMDNIAAASIHNGCRLLISPDLKLYITTGDAANTSLPQNTSSVNGKVLRINLDGTIPADNPLPGSPVWSWGHRNAQGLVMANDILYSSEHGPSNDDEINIIEKGRNYGWPDVHGFCNESGEQIFCSANNIKEPIYAWTPTVATCGLDYYNSDRIPQWKNSLLLATLKNSRLYQLKLGSDKKTVSEVNEYFNGKYGRMRDICISPEGRVYISTSNGTNDKIIVVDKK